jgi:hypothetical protein
MNHIEESWNSLAKLIFPKGSTPSDGQIYYMRKAFFSGAFVVSEMLNGLKGSSAQEQCLNEFQRELYRWQRESLPKETP